MTIPVRRPLIIPGQGELAEEQVLLYTFDGGPPETDVKDLSQSGLDGVLNGDPTFIAGPNGFGMNFDGDGDYIQVCAAGDPASPNVLQLGDFTLELVGRHSSTAGFWSWAIGEAVGGAFILGKENATGKLHCWLEGMLHGHTFTGSYDISDGSIHHCILTHDKSVQKTQFYFDGALMQDVANNADNTNYGTGLRAGGRADVFGAERWNGDLYVVSMYKAHMNADQVLRRKEELTPYLV